MVSVSRGLDLEWYRSSSLDLSLLTNPIEMDFFSMDLPSLSQTSQSFIDENSNLFGLPMVTKEEGDASSSEFDRGPNSKLEMDSEGENKCKKFPMFAENDLVDFKHILYNMLATSYNNPKEDAFVFPYETKENGKARMGFQFNPSLHPEKKLPEIYAQYFRHTKLEYVEDDPLVADLYKYYLRASVELMGKYFEKRDKFTYLYVDEPLFIPNETLCEADERIKRMTCRTRKRKKY